MKTYEIKVYRDGKWWMVEIPEIDGLTQARRLSEVEDMARSFIAVDQDVAPSEIELRNPHVIVSGEDLGSTMHDILEFRKAAQIAEERVAAIMVATARRLAKQQVPLRDIGEVLGVSHQRVHQLVQDVKSVKSAGAGMSANGNMVPTSRASASAGRAAVTPVKKVAPHSSRKVAAPAAKKAAAPAKKAAPPAKKVAPHSSRKVAAPAAKKAAAPAKKAAPPAKKVAPHSSRKVAAPAAKSAAVGKQGRTRNT